MTAQSRRQCLRGLIASVTLPWLPVARAQSVGQVAFPYYSGEQALEGLYRRAMPARARYFAEQAARLVQVTRDHCQVGTASPRDALRSTWRDALTAWQALSTPALGPVVERRSQRQIDFWPTRPALLAKALQTAPRTLPDMLRIGTPAKGFPAMDWLLHAPAQPTHCPYLLLIAEGIDAEAQALLAGYNALAQQDWSADETLARSAFAEWINQWLGGLERLRWQHIEQPLQKAATTGQGLPPGFARQSAADNRADWLAQWQALYDHARLRPDTDAQPPRPGQDFIPIQALLMGKGQIALAQRWAERLGAADAAFQQLPTDANPDTLMALSRTLKTLTVLYQTDVAAALDVPLGFSDADGD